MAGSIVSVPQEKEKATREIYMRGRLKDHMVTTLTEIGCVQAKGAAKDVGKNLNPGSSNLPSPGAAADKASGAIKGLASDAGKGTKNVSLDLSENIPNLFYDVGKNAEKVSTNFYAFKSGIG